MPIKNPKVIVISRTDSIGDVALTLPMAGLIKTKFPDVKIIFLGDTYTAPIIKCSKHVDQIWIWSDIKQLSNEEQIKWLESKNIDTFIHVFPRREIARLVQKAKIPNKIGTSHRLFHLLTCNYRVNFTRKNSTLHESQLNLKLLQPLGISAIPNLSQLTAYSGFENIPALDANFKSLLDPQKHNLILHCKSKGSALEWGVDKFISLAKALDQNKFNLFFTGTASESEFFSHDLPKQDNIFDLSGQMDLDQLIAFIHESDGLIAASTGPLHIAGLSNIKTFGLFTPRKPLHYGRWQPLGNQVIIIEEKKLSERSQPLSIEMRLVGQIVENTFNQT